ncbi:hypothetical protein FDG96_gp20 [Bacillus phage Mgbh1]|uniref:Uncharacterized protein n=1 Tax=Bacillus phage Mgbh1 TaxID=1796993 RepID=A0A142F1M2_9CAUD|nr:hypothetical protein FDG96_gp20 [Bacillus phage Mgbh1]AMQ66679.1 hypothetical protein [Bacillus phage Mgbh1]
MLINEIAEKLNTSQEIVEESLEASGFPVDPSRKYSSREVHVTTLYVRYLTLMIEANEASHGFKYTDGEEGVDKTLVSDNLRRTAQMWYNRWLAAMEEKQRQQEHSAFHIRKRA